MNEVEFEESHVNFLQRPPITKRYISQPILIVIFIILIIVTTIIVISNNGIRPRKIETINPSDPASLAIPGYVTTPK